MFPVDLYQKMLCESCLISGFQLEMGSESKENHLSCHFIHPSSVYEKLQLQLYGGTSIENTFKYIASRFLCDFLNHKYEANLLVWDSVVGRYYQRRVYGNNTLPVHSCKWRTPTRMRKVRKQANVHSTIILPATFLFCPSRYTCGFSCVFGCDTAFVVAHTHVLWLAVHCKWAGTN